MKLVTYHGPEAADGTTRFCIQHDGKSQYFPIGVPLEVSDEVAHIASEQDGQNFEIDAVKGGSKKPDPAGDDSASTSKGD